MRWAAIAYNTIPINAADNWAIAVQMYAQYYMYNVTSGSHLFGHYDIIVIIIIIIIIVIIITIIIMYAYVHVVRANTV
jgi:uncharacterized membrane protein